MKSNVICCIYIDDVFSYRSKTPGGRLVYLYPGKPGKIPRCGDCHLKLRGVGILIDIKCNHQLVLPVNILHVKNVVVRCSNKQVT